MKIFTASQIHQWDQITIQKYFQESSELMEVAAQLCVDFIKEEEIASSYAIICGIGNNGGDGLCIARMLAAEDHDVKVFVVGDSEQGSRDFKKNLQLLLNTDVALHFISEEHQSFDPDENAIIIDCLFGTGLNRPLEGWQADFVLQVNLLPNRVVSIDLPSGMLADSLEPQVGAIVESDLTLTFQIPKRSLLFEDNYPFVGDFEIIQLGLDYEFELNEACDLIYFNELEAAKLFHSRKKYAHKNSFGHAGVIAGSKGKMGAAILCSMAAMRAGAGLVTVQIPHSGESILQTALPEAMCLTDEGEFYLKTSEIQPNHSATCIGPGIDQSPETALMMRKILKQEVTGALVLDADALNIIAAKNLHHSIPEGSILTPHVGEFDRLFGKHENSFDRFKTLREKAIELKCVIVLKGAHTMVAAPDGSVSFNSSGNPGMATAGSGDVLTGVLVAMCAQKYDVVDAARLGVYLHGVAGDIAADERGGSGLLARDIIEYLPAAMDVVETTRSILGWK
jgi:hydroxyethylthiazole kinase-like uncharacterized protein yjeF